MALTPPSAAARGARAARAARRPPQDARRLFTYLVTRVTMPPDAFTLPQPDAKSRRSGVEPIRAAACPCEPLHGHLSRARYRRAARPPFVAAVGPARCPSLQPEPKPKPPPPIPQAKVREPAHAPDPHPRLHARLRPASPVQHARE